MDFSLPYYIYCESSTGDLLLQPLNVLTALSYFVVALWLFMRSQGSDSEFRQVTGFLLVFVGMCSVFWHTVNIPLGLTMDIISALLLTALLATVMCSRLLRWPLWGCALTVIIMFIFCIFLKNAGIPYLTQNGGAFLPPLALIAFVALKVQTENQTVTIYLLCAAYSLFFGVFCRSIDMLICNSFPLGTHFLSHIFAAISVVYVMKALDEIGLDEEIKVKAENEEKAKTELEMAQAENIFEID